MTETSSDRTQGAGPAPSVPPLPSAPPFSSAPAPAPPAVVPAPGRRSDRAFGILLVVAALIAVGGLAFAGGRLTAPAATATGTGGLGGRNDGFGGNGGFPGPFASGAPGLGRAGLGSGVLLTGTVESVGNGTLTIKTENGTTVDVTIQDATTYHSQSAASAADVTTGSQVQVQLEVGGAGGPAASPRASAGGAQRTTTARDVTIVSP